MAKRELDGPIPGENFTSDTRNYPWHRAPEITDLDQGVEASIKQLTTRESSYSLLTMLQAGVPIATAADIFVTSGIGAGKWTPDFALLLAGPVAHMMKIMADGYGIEYDMGLDDSPVSTIEFVKAKARIDPNRAVSVVEDVRGQLDMIKKNAAGQDTGFAGMPSPVNPAAKPDAGMGEAPMGEEQPMPPEEGMM